MGKGILLFLGVILMSCAKNVKPEDFHYLNGYWEIEKVSFADGSTKAFKANTLIDYWKIEDTTGFRKKMQPTLQGTYTTSDDAEFFTIVERNARFWLVYKKDNEVWEEVLISLSENNFSVTDPSNKKYTYKRFEPLDLNE